VQARAFADRMFSPKAAFSELASALTGDGDVA
jgi:hypothetical protein